MKSVNLIIVFLIERKKYDEFCFELQNKNIIPGKK